MKKLFILLSFIALFGTVKASDNVIYFQAIGINLCEEGKWSGWVPIYDAVDIMMNVDRHFISLHYSFNDGTTSVERIDYVNLKEVIFDGGKYFTGLGTDNTYNPINIDLYFYNSGLTILKLYYNNREGYKFKLKVL